MPYRKRAGIYIHIPFCERKCDYCSFYSESFQEKVAKKFIRALNREIKYSEYFKEIHRIDTIYVGGGTPSVLPINLLSELLDLIGEKFRSHRDKQQQEYTFEVNPSSINKEKQNLLKTEGVNRISIGVQSFIDKELDFLGRLHNAKEAEDKVREVADSGVRNVSLDLIYGLPLQDLASWKFSLGKAISLPIKHISSYSLSYEEGSPLWGKLQRNKFNKIAPELEETLYHRMINELKRNNFNHYEISSFGKPGYKSRHNLIYWKGKNYLGFGPSAHSYFQSGEEHIRWSNDSNIRNYIDPQKKNIKHKEKLSQEQRMTEFILLRLRLTKGFELKEFEAEFGISFKEFLNDKLDYFLKNDFLYKKQARIYIPESKMFISDEIISKILSYSIIR